MKDIISFEKAKALKEAGIMPPKTEVGQVWYDNSGSVFYINDDDLSLDFSTVVDLKSGKPIWYKPMNDTVYAFTTSELLKILSLRIFIEMKGDVFLVEYYKIINGDFFCDRIEGEHLADLLADVLLKRLEF